MSSTAIRNLINNNIDKVIVRAKSEVKKESRKQVTKLKEKIPTPEELKQKFVTTACSEKAQAKVEKLFEKNKNLLDKLLNKLNQSKEKLSELDSKLNKIRGVIDKIKDILAIIAGILIALEIIVRVAPAGLAASSGPAASGIIIDRLGKAIDYGKAKIKEYGSLTQALLANLPKYLEKALAVIALIATAIIALNTLIALINKLKTFLEFIYGKYIENCTIANQSPIDNGNINEDLLLANDNIPSGVIDNMSIYYNDLLQTLAEGGFTLQAQRIYKVIDTSNALQKTYTLIETPKTI